MSGLFTALNRKNPVEFFPVIDEKENTYTDLMTRFGSGEYGFFSPDMIHHIVENKEDVEPGTHALVFHLTIPVSRLFKLWEIKICLPRLGVNLGREEKNAILDSRDPDLVKPSLPVRFTREGVGEKAKGVDPRIAVADRNTKSVVCIGGKDSSGEWSHFGCGYNVLAFLNVLSIKECEKHIARMVANNNNKGMGLQTSEIINIIKTNLAIKNELDRTFISFEYDESDPHIYELLKTINIIYGLNIIWRTLYNNTPEKQEHFYCLLVKQIFSGTIDSDGNAVGHTVIYTVDNSGTLYMCDPQTGKWKSAFTQKAVMAIGKNYEGFSILTSEDSVVQGIHQSTFGSVRPTPTFGTGFRAAVPTQSFGTGSDAAGQTQSFGTGFGAAGPSPGSASSRRRGAQRSRRRDASALRAPIGWGNRGGGNIRINKTKKRKGGGDDKANKTRKKSHSRKHVRHVKSGKNVLPHGIEAHGSHLKKVIGPDDISDKELEKHIRHLKKGSEKWKKKYGNKNK